MLKAARPIRLHSNETIATTQYHEGTALFVPEFIGTISFEWMRR